MEKKKNEVYIHNDMNTIPLVDFTSIELNLLFSILSQIKDKGISEVTYTYEELKSLSNYDKTNSTKKFTKDLEKTYDKLIALNVKIGTSRKWTKFVFFTTYTVDEDSKTISIATNEKFEHLINKLTGNFTRFELAEFTSLSSVYSKTAYKQLKQFRKTGYLILDIEKFREIFCVPDSYRMCNINTRVLQPIEKELPSFFKNFEIKKLAKGKGRTITHIEFLFMPEDDILPNGKYKIKKGKKIIEKSIIEMNEEEIKSKFPDVPEHLK